MDITTISLNPESIIHGHHNYKSQPGECHTWTLHPKSPVMEETLTFQQEAQPQELLTDLTPTLFVGLF